jgi:hypothetical protein
MRDGVVGQLDLDTEVLGEQVGTLLSDEERGRVGVRAQVLGADRQVDTLEALGTEDVESAIDNTAVLLGAHGASAQRVPSGLDVVRDPVVCESGLMSMW